VPTAQTFEDKQFVSCRLFRADFERRFHPLSWICQCLLSLTQFWTTSALFSASLTCSCHQLWFSIKI